MIYAGLCVDQNIVQNVGFACGECYNGNCCKEMSCFQTGLNLWQSLEVDSQVNGCNHETDNGEAHISHPGWELLASTYCFNVSIDSRMRSGGAPCASFF